MQIVSNTMIKRAIKYIVSCIAAKLVRFRLLPNMVVLNMDGGICSQMHFYLVGKMLESQGLKVVYSLDWFAKDGMDIDGRFCRNFDLLTAFPLINLPMLKNGFIKRIYKIAFRHHNEYLKRADDTQWQAIQSPSYIKGYFKETDDMFASVFTEIFYVNKEVLDEENRAKFEEIDKIASERGACALHVRRGDLSKYHEAYGQPAAIEYFRQSCELVASINPSTKIFLFSDEPEWCEDNLIPALVGYDIEICRNNESDKGWCDLLLMSRCNHHITSQGSMGRYAAKLRPADRSNGIVTLTDNPELAEWATRFENGVVIKNLHKKS